MWRRTASVRDAIEDVLPRSFSFNALYLAARWLAVTRSSYFSECGKGPKKSTSPRPGGRPVA